MREDLGDHRGIFDGGDDLQGAAALGAVFYVDSDHPFEQPGPAGAGRQRGRWRVTVVSCALALTGALGKPGTGRLPAWRPEDGMISGRSLALGASTGSGRREAAEAPRAATRWAGAGINNNPGGNLHIMQIMRARAGQHGAQRSVAHNSGHYVELPTTDHGWVGSAKPLPKPQTIGGGKAQRRAGTRRAERR